MPTRVLSISSLLALMLVPSAVVQSGALPKGSNLGQGSWCTAALPVNWSTPLTASRPTLLAQPDIYSCEVLALPPAGHGSITQTSVSISLSASKAHLPAGVQLRQVLLFDCDEKMWGLSGVQNTGSSCTSSLPMLRVACNQWLVSVPTGLHAHSQACSPPGTAFATPDSLIGRVLVMQSHWQLPADLVNTAIELPALQLRLGVAAADSAPGPGPHPSRQHAPALLGTFTGSGIYPPSRLSGGLQAFSLPVAAEPHTAAAAATATAVLECSKRCTYVPMGKLFSRPVTVVGYGFTTFDRAVNVSLHIQRGKWGRRAGDVRVTTAAGGAVSELLEPFQLHAGDVVRWSCTYDTSNTQAGSRLTGGYNSNPSSQQEQCNVMLHYWPRRESLRGCSAALNSDALLGQNMCSSEAEDLLALKAAEDNQFPMRRMYQEHSFPPARWMGGWKATQLVLQMSAVWMCLWGFQTLLGSCKALGPIHRRFISLHAGQQRNVSLYLTHLVLDTAMLVYVFQVVIELWCGLTETVAEVRVGMVGFNYIVACYALELTWRTSVGTMLAIHHIGTITVVLLYAGELSPHTYRVANNIIVLAACALMEQPTYVALLLKRMMPSHSIHVVRAARVGYISWFVVKGASAVLAVSMFREDWHLMPLWIKVNFTATWLVAAVVQSWSGFIQHRIYKDIARAHTRSKWENKQALLKRQAAEAFALRAQISAGTSSGRSELDSSPSLLSQRSTNSELDAPLLARRRFLTQSTEGTDFDGSPFGLFAAAVPVDDDAAAAAASFLHGESSGTDLGADPVDCTVPPVAAWEESGWSWGTTSQRPPLRNSNSCVAPGVTEPGNEALQPNTSLPLCVERAVSRSEGGLYGTPDNTDKLE